MNCNLSVKAGPEIKGEVTSSSWENREKFAAAREKCFLTEDRHTTEAWLYYKLISADLFFLYFNIGPNNNKTNINNPKKKKKCCKKFFCKPLACLILILFLFFKGAKSEDY